MGIRTLFQPQPTLTDEQVSRGLRWLTVDESADVERAVTDAQARHSADR